MLNKEREYRPIKYFLEKYGVSATYMNDLCRNRKIPYVRSSAGERAVRLICENEFIAYLETTRVESDDAILQSIQQVA